jgi:protoporphyrinogen oxidase
MLDRRVRGWLIASSILVTTSSPKTPPISESRIYLTEIPALDFARCTDRARFVDHEEWRMTKQTAVIIGAGPAGLTAAYELLERSDVKPIVLEMSEYMGGIARTINHKGNRIDIGGHRFFSKSDRVMDWWLNILPMEETAGGEALVSYQNKSRTVHGDAVADPEKTDEVMLVRNRKSRIYFLRRFFNYPITLSADTVAKLGLWRTFKMGVSYLKAMALPIKNEKNLEQFFINRFGRELYQTFFKSYTEKVWGTRCDEISAEWGAQRIKGLSITKAVTHALKKLFKRSSKDVGQKDVETSLIERFLYPKYGPGQMWEEVAKKVIERGGEIHTRWVVEVLETNQNRITGVVARNLDTNEQRRFEGDYFFSTMPVKELVRNLEAEVPADVKAVAEGLVYRDFMTVGLLVDKLKLTDSGDGKKLISDNWIYIQEPDVKVGRLQIFNNWSPYMVADPSKVWLGLEYFCNEGDELWTQTDAEAMELGKAELHKIDVIDRADVVDACVIRMPKTYPAYFGSYGSFDVLRQWIDGFQNLFLVGRNGMHKYNNQDHSMLTAMTAVDNIIAGRTDKENIWQVNTEQDYHEEKATTQEPVATEANADTTPRKRSSSRELAGASTE